LFISVLKRNNGKPASRPALYRAVWNLHLTPSTNSIDVIVSRIRKKGRDTKIRPAVGYS